MKRLTLIALCVSSTIQWAAAAPPWAELIRVEKIWDAAPHNAFTDLVDWQDQFWCAFREGRRHVSADGKIRVLNSADGETWNSAALVELEHFDLRDAGLSVMPDGRLMLCGGAAPRERDNQEAPTGTFVAFSEDGTHWTKPQILVDPRRWLWRMEWHDGRAYGISYATPEGHPYTSLLTSDDGSQVDELVPKLFGEGYPTEAALNFDSDDTLYVLQRRDGKTNVNSAFLGTSRPPYKDWTWHDLKTFFGGPTLVKLPSGTWIAAGRMLGADGPKTVIAQLDVEQHTLTPILDLPSGGDTSYPGLVWKDGILWVSYYSSHEGKTNIYLAQVRIE